MPSIKLANQGAISLAKKIILSRDYLFKLSKICLIILNTDVLHKF